MIDWKGLLDSLGIECWTPPAKNVAKDCVNIRCPCPGCQDRSNHGGFNTVTGTYRCWKCKGTYAAQALAWAAHITIDEAHRRIAQYTTGENIPPERKKPVYAQSLELPGGPLEEMHRKYLLGRGLDPDFLVRYYDIRGTKLFTKWHDKDWSLRIIIPIKDYTGRIVTFQGRTIVKDPNVVRYFACPPQYALANNKHLVYGADLAWHRDTVIAVEGVVDAWKLGPGAVATFGTSMTQEQLVLLAHWKHVIFFFDPEKLAQKHAEEYGRTLAYLGSDVEMAYEDFGTFPNGDKRDLGDLSPHEIARIKNELGL